MSALDLLAACLVMVIWGFNFIAIKIGVAETPPLLLGALRFVVLAFPAVLLVPRPRVSFWPLVAYALTISFGQFAFLFSAIHAGMPAGLASLVLQVQAFIAPVIAAVVLGERLQRKTVAGLSIAFVGLAVIVIASRGDASIPILAFALALCAAVSWAVGNILSKYIATTDVVGLVVWSGLIPIVPFLAMSWLIEGGPRIAQAISHLSLSTVGAVVYLAYGASLLAYSLWSSLVVRYPVQMIAPLTLLIPVIGMAAAWVAFDEALSTAQVSGSAIIIAGLLVNMFGGAVFGGRR